MTVLMKKSASTFLIRLKNASVGSAFFRMKRKTLFLILLPILFATEFWQTPIRVKAMSKKFKDTETLDLFERFYPVRSPAVVSATVDLSGKIKRLVSLILKESPKTREQIAAEMAEAMNCPSFSKAMLDNYSSEANTDHQITLYNLSFWFAWLKRRECGTSF